MFIILVYDITDSKSNKFKKLCNKYLHRVQNSVFEGEITSSKLKELKNKLNNIVDKENDSILIYSIDNNKWIEKEIIGIEKNEISNFI